MKRVALLAALVAILLLATALPFLPGRHDVLAVPLSMTARCFGIASLLLVPIGLAWLLYESWPASDAVRRGRTGFVVATLGAGSFAMLVAALAALMSAGAALAVAVLAAEGLVLWRIGPRLLHWARAPRGRDAAAALALILAPIAVVGSQLALGPLLTALAWNQTMDGVTPLVADIERYRVANGHYPRALFSEWMDYRPGVIGVAGYKYEATGDAYSLAVEVPTFSFDSREFLHYNPTDAHVMTSHDADLLRRTAAELVHYRGYHHAIPAGRPHWVMLSFD